MIKKSNVTIRSADLDDASTLKLIYDSDHPRSCALDARRELIIPTLDEVREAMGHKELGRGPFSVIEDTSGSVRGFCAIRGINPELSYSEFVLIFLNEDDYVGAMAEEAFDYLCGLAFERMTLKKVVTHCLDCEQSYRNFLLSHGFRSDGRQRDVFFNRGRWFDLEALSLFHESTNYAVRTKSA